MAKSFLPLLLMGFGWSSWVEPAAMNEATPPGVVAIKTGQSVSQGTGVSRTWCGVALIDPECPFLSEFCTCE